MASGSEYNINSPLWQHVNVLEKRNERGGNKRFRCNFCNGEFTGSYSRVKAHLLKIGGFGIKKCAKVSVELHKELLSQMEEVDRRNKPVDLPHSHQMLSSTSSTTPTGGGHGLPTAPTLPTTYQMMCSSVELKKRKVTGKGPLEQAFNTDAREALTSHIARMFYAGGLPFHFARNPYYLKAFSFAANTNIGGYIPLGYNSLRTILLQKERANVGSYDSLHDRGNIDPHSWWLLYGSSAPKLQKIALKLLCQPCSSFCAERNWSTYSFIHSMRRNKILPERAEDLVFIHTNLRLLSRKQEQYNQGESRLWDVCGDEFDPLDGAGELEIATLSLDEPELENDIGSNVENME